VQFDASHDFDARPEQVGALMVDPDFEARVDLPDLAPPDVVVHAQEGDDTVLRLRYEFIGHLDPIAKRVVGNRRLTFLQEVRLDVEAGRGMLRLAVESDPKRVRGEAAIRIDGTAGDACVRTLRGTFTVSLPLVGGTAERALLPGILRRFDVEAVALAQRLREGQR
jgi:hypothetical protein